MSRQEKHLLWASNLWYLSEGLLGPLFAVYTQRLGGNILDVSWAWAVYLVVSGLATMYVGKIAQTKVRQQTFVLIGYILTTLLTIAFLFITAPWQLMLVQVGLGLAQALATPTWFALYANVETQSSAGTLWGRMQGQSSMFTAAALVVGGIIATQYGFEVLFSLMALVHAAATVSIWRSFREDQTYEEPQSMEIGEVALS